MTPVKREELPELPKGWGWYRDSGIWFAESSEETIVGCSNNHILVELLEPTNTGFPLAVVAAVLCANGVTLPEVPGRSSLLGGK